MRLEQSQAGLDAAKDRSLRTVRRKTNHIRRPADPGGVPHPSSHEEQLRLWVASGGELSQEIGVRLLNVARHRGDRAGGGSRGDRPKQAPAQIG